MQSIAKACHGVKGLGDGPKAGSLKNKSSVICKQGF